MVLRYLIVLTFLCFCWVSNAQVSTLVLDKPVQIPQGWINIPTDPYVFFIIPSDIKNKSSLSVRYVGTDHMSPEVIKALSEKKLLKRSVSSIEETWIAKGEGYWVIQSIGEAKKLPARERLIEIVSEGRR